MNFAKQMALVPVENVTAPTRSLIAKIMLLMLLSILAVGGQINNVWAVPGGQCIIDQIAKEPFNGRGLPKKAFTIILNDLATGTGLWRAPYLLNTGGNTGRTAAMPTPPAKPSKRSCCTFETADLLMSLL